MQNIVTAKSLLLWNSINLVENAKLEKIEIGDYFANLFQVKANGREYEATHDSYFEFLNQFRATILSIQYDTHEIITDKTNVVISLTAHITRTDNSVENFEAILILKFNPDNRIVLWNEVYVKTT